MRNSVHVPLLGLLPVLLVARAPGQTRDAELALIFRPFETDQVTLSPDGTHLAYTERRGENLFLVLRDLAANKIVSTFISTA